MAYVIRMSLQQAPGSRTKHKNRSPERVLEKLRERVAKDGRFVFLAEIVYPNKPAKTDIVLRNVRLTEGKEYCGQHPGPCQVHPFFGPRPKRRYKLLEWDDWVAFHSLVNDVLDKLRIDADVWTKPREIMDKGKQFFVRRGLRRRIRFDWDERPGPYGINQQIWNHGTEDQFEVEDEKAEEKQETKVRSEERAHLAGQEDPGSDGKAAAETAHEVRNASMEMPRIRFEGDSPVAADPGERCTVGKGPSSGKEVPLGSVLESNDRRARLGAIEG